LRWMSCGTRTKHCRGNEEFTTRDTEDTEQEMIREMPHEACGVFGITGNPEASVLTYLGLYALQHRGQETAGIAAWSEGRMRTFTGEGLVADVFDRGALEQLPGEHAIGHVRYSTTGASQLSNAQPIVANYRGGWLGLAHNGNLTNADELKRELEERGAIFQTTTDTELLIHLIAQSPSHDFFEALKISLMRLRGAYSFVIQKDDQLIAVRDPRGFRPLCVGRLGEAWCVASETCAFDMINAKYVRDVEPGEILLLSKEGMKSLKPFPAAERMSCIFELIYYSRPDSQQEGRSIYAIREELGRQLAREHPAQADVVIAVPDSSNVAAMGYAAESGIALGQGLVRSHYVGRTFIEPDQTIRDFGAKLKYNVVKSVLEGKRVVVVDDSIVRGTTSRKIVKMIRAAGAAEIHFRVSSPPWKSPCFFGIDTPSSAELIGSSHSVEEIRQKIGVDTLGFLSEEGMLKVVGGNRGYCRSCFTGVYPDGRPEERAKERNDRGNIGSENNGWGLRSKKMPRELFERVSREQE